METLIKGYAYQLGGITSHLTVCTLLMHAALELRPTTSILWTHNAGGSWDTTILELVVIAQDSSRSEELR